MASLMFESESSLERCSHLFTVLKIPPTLVEIRDHRLAPTHTHTHTHTHTQLIATQDNVWRPTTSSSQLNTSWSL